MLHFERCGASFLDGAVSPFLVKVECALCMIHLQGTANRKQISGHYVSQLNRLAQALLLSHQPQIKGWLAPKPRAPCSRTLRTQHQRNLTGGAAYSG